MALPTEDDGVRERLGVVASLRATTDGRLCIVLDDVCRQSGTDTSSWNHQRFFTAIEYPQEMVQTLALTKEQFAQIGENILIRLLAQAEALAKGDRGAA